jgi:hypothetical protein
MDAHLDNGGEPELMAKMSEADFESKAAAIDIEWDASRSELWKSRIGDYQSGAASQQADDLQLQQFGKLYQDSGWTEAEILAWLEVRCNKILKRRDSALPSDNRQTLG